MALSTAVPASERTAIRKYAALEERILERDQVGASDILYQLIRDGRPLAEMLGETVRIHAPYTSVPYHQRLDDGFARFVNNDHCLLSARASLRLPGIASEELRFLPPAQTRRSLPTWLGPRAPLPARTRPWPATRPGSSRGRSSPGRNGSIAGRVRILRTLQEVRAGRNGAHNAHPTELPGLTGL